MTSQPGKNLIAMHILLDISRSKGKLSIKFGRLIEYNIRNIFLEYLYTKCCEKKLFLDSFLKSQNLWISSRKFYIVCFKFMPSWGLSKYIRIKLRSASFSLYEGFLKNKKRSRTSLCSSFSAWFFKKTFPLLYSINWQNFIIWLLVPR